MSTSGYTSPSEPTSSYDRNAPDTGHLWRPRFETILKHGINTEEQTLLERPRTARSSTTQMP